MTSSGSYEDSDSDVESQYPQGNNSGGGNGSNNAIRYNPDGQQIRAVDNVWKLSNIFYHSRIIMEIVVIISVLDLQ